MKLVETRICETMVHLRYADNPDNAEARIWIDFQLPLKDLTLPGSDMGSPLGDPEIRYLGVIRQAALRHVRKVLGEETQRIADHIHRKT